MKKELSHLPMKKQKSYWESSLGLLTPTVRRRIIKPGRRDSLTTGLMGEVSIWNPSKY
jgi:hypothetical protein